MHDVALGVLMAAAVDYPLARVCRGDEQHVHRVLKLIAKADRPAALVEARSRVEPPGNALVHRPCVHISVKSLRAGAQLKPAQKRVPAAAHAVKRFKRRLRRAQRAKLILAAAPAREHRHIVREHRYNRGGRRVVTARLARERAHGHGLRAGEVGFRVGAHERAAARLNAHGLRVRRAHDGLHRPIKAQTRRTLDDEYARVCVGGDERRGLHPPRTQLFFPAGVPRRIAHAAAPEVSRGEEAYPLAARVAPEGFVADHGVHVRRGRGDAHLPCVFKPHAA